MKRGLLLLVVQTKHLKIIRGESNLQNRHKLFEHELSSLYNLLRKYSQDVSIIF
jgi:hypothetical protein